MPNANLTDRFIRSKKPGSRRVEYWDQDTPALGLRVGTSGAKTFVFRYRTTDGKRRRMTLGRYPGLTLDGARRKAQAARLAVTEGTDPVGERKREEREQAAARRKTFSTLAEDYIERHAKPKKRSWREDQRILRADVLPRWGGLPIAEIGRREVIELLDDKAATAPVAANRLRSLLSKVFVFGIQRGYLDVNHAQYVDPPTKERPRDRVLSPDEIRRLWQALDDEHPVTAATYRLRLLTGQRSKEVQTMRWEDLEGDWWTIPAEVAKNGVAHRVPLSSQARAILEELRPLTGSSDWVCESPALPGKPVDRTNKATQRLRRVAELEDWQPHDLRRTAASGMAELGVDERVIARVLNHTVRSITAQVYNRYSYDEEKRRALELWGERVEAIVSGEDLAEVFAIS